MGKKILLVLAVVFLFASQVRAEGESDIKFNPIGAAVSTWDTFMGVASFPVKGLIYGAVIVRNGLSHDKDKICYYCIVGEKHPVGRHEYCKY